MLAGSIVVVVDGSVDVVAMMVVDVVEVEVVLVHGGVVGHLLPQPHAPAS